MIKTGQDTYGFTLYHVYFNGLKRSGIETNFLLTYNGRQAPGLKYLLENDYKGKLFLDSGAYPASKKHTDLDIDDYITFVNQYGDHFQGIAQLDYIPRIQDGTLEQQIEKSERLTWERFLYSWPRIRPELRPKFIYIIHAEDTNKLLRNALEWRDPDGQGIEYIGLGLSTTDMAFRWKQIEIANKLFKEYNYKGQVHGFGLQVVNVIQTCPYMTSSDSSSAIRDQMRGYVFIDGKQIKISDDTSPHHKSQLTNAQRELILPKLRKHAEDMGIDFDLAQTCAQERYLWGCKERDKYILANYKKHYNKPVSNLLQR